LLVQTLRENNKQDIDTTLAALGLTRKDSCSLCLSLEAGILRVYVAPSSSKLTEDGVNLAEFHVYLDEGAGLGEEDSGEVAFPR
jgi:hypothetical protein